MPTPANASDTYKQQIVTIASGGVNVDHYGATGDALTDDSVALQAAIVAAGANGTVIFTPGKTYMYGRSLYFYPGQTFIGYGATVKRMATVASQIQVGGVSGNNITVADGSVFAVGMEVAGWTDNTEFCSLTRVTGVAGNVVTVAGFAQASEAIATPGDNDYLSVVPIFLSGTLSLSFGPLDATPDDVKVIGLTFDGNVANNGGSTAPLRWELMREISQLGDRSIVDSCTFKNTPGEAIVGIGYDSKITNSHFMDVNGNGIHLSGGDGCTLSGLTFSNMNVLERGTTDTFTANATTEFITFSTETPVNGQVITVSSSANDLPAGLSALTTYYAVGATGSTCQLSLTVGGSAVNITDAGTGTHTARIGTNLGHQGGAIDYSTVCKQINIVDVNVDGALAAIGSVSVEADGSVFTNINARNCDRHYIQCESTLTELAITGGIADTCNLFHLQGSGVSVKNVTSIDTPVLVGSSNSNVDIVVSMPTNTVDDCILVSADNNNINAVCTGGYTALAFGGGSTGNNVNIKAINNYQNGIEVGGTNDSIASFNLIEPHILLESGYTESSTYRGIDFGGSGIIKGGSINCSIGVSGRAIDFRANCDDSLIDGLVIIAVGTPADICRVNGQDTISCRNMTFPAGTSSANAFTIGASTNFNPVNNYAIDGSTLLTGV